MLVVREKGSSESRHSQYKKALTFPVALCLHNLTCPKLPFPRGRDLSRENQRLPSTPRAPKVSSLEGTTWR